VQENCVLQVLDESENSIVPFQERTAPLSTLSRSAPDHAEARISTLTGATEHQGRSDSYQVLKIEFLSLALFFLSHAVPKSVVRFWTW
jgi:hypothetical protein